MANQLVDIEKMTSEIKEALLQRQLRKAEELAIFLLKEHPLLTQAWLSLGEALYHQGYKGAAKEVFKRAILLDPQAAWIKTIEPIINEINVESERKDINDLLEVPRKTVAAAILVKNEERCIKRCIDSIIKAVDEVVVIDTGSTDKTLDIVSSYKDIKLLHFEWCDDFAAARNFGLDHIESDWVLWIDADEYLHQDDVANVKLVAGIFDSIEPVPILRVGQFNFMGNSLSINYDQSRMFPLRRGLKYFGRVHEQIRPQNGKPNDRFSAAVQIRLLHDGYDSRVMNDKRKLERNISLLKKMISEEPDIPSWWLFLGRETLATGNIDEAINILLEAEKRALVTPWFGRSPEIYVNLIRAYIIKDELDLAEQVCYRAIKKDPDFHYLLGCIKIKQAVKLYKEAEKHLNDSKQLFSSYRGIVSPDNRIAEYKADLAIADISRLTGNLASAKMVFDSVLSKYPELNGPKTQLEIIENQRNLLNALSAQSN